MYNFQHEKQKINFLPGNLTDLFHWLRIKQSKAPKSSTTIYKSVFSSKKYYFHIFHHFVYFHIFSYISIYIGPMPSPGQAGSSTGIGLPRWSGSDLLGTNKRKINDFCINSAKIQDPCKNNAKINDFCIKYAKIVIPA